MIGDGVSDLLLPSKLWLECMRPKEAADVLRLCEDADPVPVLKERSFLPASFSWLLVAALAALMASRGVPMVFRS